MKEEITTLYRYERNYVLLDASFELGLGDSMFADYKLLLTEYKVVKHTDKGFWINIHWNKQRWVSMSGRKRHAYPIKEDALKNFIKRTSKALIFSKGNVRKAEGFLEAAKLIKTDSSDETANEVGDRK